MCGIAGKLWFDAARPADVASVSALVAALAHRGPDGEGLQADGPCALGHRRLAIVDLSPRGRQPMAGADGRTWLVANGEIYNHAELRRDLGARGHVFRSDCDSEVLLPLYREYWEREGPACLERLEGMFAFALWDGRARRLILARDRMGQKPLVWAATREGLVFASELGALGRDPLVDRSPDWRALSGLLDFQCIAPPRTAWVGASRLPPGSVLVAEGDGRIEVRRWFRLAPGDDAAAAPTLDEAAEHVAELFDRSVRRRLMADVPVGLFLSGGLDSAAVLAAMAQAGGTVRSFTIGFEESDFDEAARARKLARLFGTEHVEAVVAPDLLALLDEVLVRHGEPFADASALPVALVSRLARRSVKVVLTGDGGDEAFAGYDRYRALGLAARLDSRWAGPARAGVRLAAAALGPGSSLLGHLPDDAPLSDDQAVLAVQESFSGSGGRGFGARARRFANALPLTPRRRNDAWRRSLPRRLRAALLTPEGQARFGPSAFHGADLPRSLALNEALALDAGSYLPDDVLTKLDLASMGVALEARSPFMDSELLQYAFALPGRFKLGTPARADRAVLREDGGLPGGWPAGVSRGGFAPASGETPLPLFGSVSKLVLRRALGRRLPADVLAAPKRGFGVPLGRWLAGPLAGHVRDVLLSPTARARGLFRPAAVQTLLDAHASGRVAAQEAIYTLLVLERWLLAEEERR